MEPEINNYDNICFTVGIVLLIILLLPLTIYYSKINDDITTCLLLIIIVGYIELLLTILHFYLNLIKKNIQFNFRIALFTFNFY
jgi:hypothetical protein